MSAVTSIASSRWHRSRTKGRSGVPLRMPHSTVVLDLAGRYDLIAALRFSSMMNGCFFLLINGIREYYPNPLCRGRSLPGTPPTVKYIGRVTLMDKTESTVRNILTAIEAPLYDIGVLSDRGMLPELDDISAAAVLDRLSLLKYRHVRGSHIYIRPSGEHRYTALDDLNEVSLAKLSADGFKPCAVVETSAGNFQAWLKHAIVFPKLIGTLFLPIGNRG